MKSAFEAGETGSTISGILYLMDGLRNDRIYLCNIFLDVALRNLEETSLGFLQ